MPDKIKLLKNLGFSEEMLMHLKNSDERDGLVVFEDSQNFESFNFDPVDTTNMIINKS